MYYKIFELETGYFTIYQRTPYSKIIFQLGDDEPIIYDTLEELLDLFYFISFYDWAELVLESDFPEYLKNNLGY